MPSLAIGGTEALAGKVTCPKRPAELYHSRSRMRCQSAQFRVVLFSASSPASRSTFCASGSPLSESEVHLRGDSTLLGIILVYLEEIRKYLRFQMSQQPYLAGLPRPSPSTPARSLPPGETSTSAFIPIPGVTTGWDAVARAPISSPDWLAGWMWKKYIICSVSPPPFPGGLHRARGCEMH